MNESTSNSENPTTQLKILWHRLWNKLMTNILVPEGITVHGELPPATDLPRIDTLFVRDKGTRWTARQRAKLPDGVRDRHMKYHLLENKITESVTDDSLHQALTYDYLYRGSHQLSKDEVQNYVVSAKTPHKSKLEAWGYKLAENPGIYVTTIPVLERNILIILNELRDTPYNNYFRLFASRKKIRRSAMEFVTQQPQQNFPEDVWTVVFALLKAYGLEDLDMQHELTLESLLEAGDAMRKSVIASASPDDLSESIRKNVIANALPDELSENIRKNIIANASPDELSENIRKNIIANASHDELSENIRKNIIANASLDELGEGVRENVIANAPLEKRLVGLEVEDMQALMKEIETYLSKQDADEATI